MSHEDLPRNPLAPELLVPLLAQLAERFLRPAVPPFPPRELVRHAHQDATQPFALPGREDQDAGQVVVVPRQFLFGEEADDLAGMGGPAVVAFALRSSF